MVDPGWENTWEFQSPRQQVTPKPEEKPAELITRQPMWLFVSSAGERVLSKLPVEVEVKMEGPEEDSMVSAFVFCCNSLHVYASAASRAVAENYFHDQVVQSFHYYLGVRREDLAPDAAAIQARYKANFEVSQPPVR